MNLRKAGLWPAVCAPVSNVIRVVRVHLREKFTLPANQRDCVAEIARWRATEVKD